MDAMALLCTLHADGPATLKRLRQSGCTTLDGLATLDADRVAVILACTPASARRLQREAESLRMRLSGEGLERELPPPTEIPRSSRPYTSSPGASARAAQALETHAPLQKLSVAPRTRTHAAEHMSAADKSFSADLDAPPSALPRPASRDPHPASRDPHTASRDPQMAPRDPQTTSHDAHAASHAPNTPPPQTPAHPAENVPSSGAGLEARDIRLVHRVLESWRARDVEDSGSTRDASPTSPASPAFLGAGFMASAFTSGSSASGYVTAGSDGVSRSAYDIDVSERARPYGDASSRDELETGTPLRIGLVDSLDADLCAQLCAAGVFTLEALAARDAVELSSRVPASFSRLSRLIALARRALPASSNAKQARAAQPFTARAPASFASAQPSSLASALTAPLDLSLPLARSHAGQPPKISWSELPPIFEARGLGLELPEALKTTPPVLPKSRPARTSETGREGAGGPFA